MFTTANLRLYIILSALLIFSGCAQKTKIIITPTAHTPVISSTTPSSTITPPTKTTNPTPKQTPPTEIQKTEKIPSPDQPVNQTINITLQVPGQEYNLNLPTSSTVYEAMLQAKQTNNLEFTDTKFGNLGYFIETINGQTNDTHNKQFWIYYINNKKATIGVSNYILQSGDNITWKYEKADF